MEDTLENLKKQIELLKSIRHIGEVKNKELEKTVLKLTDELEQARRRYFRLKEEKRPWRFSLFKLEKYDEYKDRYR